jgi:ubiquinone biosynthesis protein COQ9
VRGLLVLPANAALGLRLAWETADLLWRWAGDTATDENHYSKRAILSGILLTALPLRLFDGEAAARRFVEARVANVMSFEAWKAGLPTTDWPAQVAGFLGRLRYAR